MKKTQQKIQSPKIQMLCSSTNDFLLTTTGFVNFETFWLEKLDLQGRRQSIKISIDLQVWNFK